MKKGGLLTFVTVLLLMFCFNIVTVDGLNQNGASTVIKSTSITSLKALNDSSIKITWKKCKNVSGYKVYRSTSKKGKYKCIKTVKGTKNNYYTDKNLVPNKTYYYKIKVYLKKSKKTYNSKFSGIKSVKTKRLSVPEITNIYRTKDNKLKIYFEPISDVKGYKIYRSNGSDDEFVCIDTIGNSDNYYIDQTSKAGKTYLYKITSYKNINSKNYESEFSNSISGTTAKKDDNTSEVDDSDTKDVEDTNNSENNSDDISNEILKLVNEDRASLGLSPLKMTSGLNKVAKLRAEEIATLYSHTRPNGKSFGTAYDDLGVKCKSIRGENLMYGVSTAEAFFKAWYNSPGHKANMERKEYTKIGIYVYKDSNGVLHAAQEFSD